MEKEAKYKWRILSADQGGNGKNRYISRSQKPKILFLLHKRIIPRKSFVS